jgi:hypothetical protein
MISDGDLLLYYYRDGLDAAERTRIGAALSEQPDLAHRLHRLVARLDAAAVMPEVPVPAHTQQRWQIALDRAAQSDTRPAAITVRRSSTDSRWQAAAAAAAVLTLVVIIQVAMQPWPNQSTQNALPASTPAARSPSEASAYERGLRWHLANTEWRLAKLDSAKPEERARLIERIVAQNRMYALAAERANEPQLARVLRAFTPILESIEDNRRGSSESDIARLTFEMRAIQARLNPEANTSYNEQSFAL